MEFVIVALPTLLTVLVMKYMFNHEINTKEFFIHLGGGLLAAGLCLGITYGVLYSSMYDTEVWNGQVTGKSREVEICSGEMSSCKHYTLHTKCHTNSKGKQSCKTYRVYDYPYEVDWFVKTNVGKTFEIERVNRQGTKEPPRYSQVQIGDFAAAKHNYINYLLGSEDSLFYAKMLKEDTDPNLVKVLPDYPQTFDYYKINHFVNLTPLVTPGYNGYLSEVLKTLGPTKQLNIVMVQYDYALTAFPDAAIAKWRGGKKNDVIMFFGVDKDGTVKHFQSTSFAKGMKNELLHATLRMEMIGATMSLDTVKKAVEVTEKNFNRLPNEEFKYLVYKLQPTTGAMLIAAFFSLLMSIGIGVYLRRVDL